MRRKPAATDHRDTCPIKRIVVGTHQLNYVVPVVHKSAGSTTHTRQGTPAFLVQGEASTYTMHIETKSHKGYLGMSYGTERIEAVKARTAPCMVATEDFVFLYNRGISLLSDKQINQTRGEKALLVHDNIRFRRNFTFSVQQRYAGLVNKTVDENPSIDLHLYPSLSLQEHQQHAP